MSRQKFIQPFRTILQANHLCPPVNCAQTPAFLRQSIAARSVKPLKYYSTTPEAVPNDSKSDPGTGDASTKDSIGNENLATTELEAKSREIIDLKDKYLRSVADFRNLQERTKRDIEQARNFAISKFARDLVESVDNLDRALATVDNTHASGSGSGNDNGQNGAANTAFRDLHQGLKMTESILMSTLKKHGLDRFDPSTAGDKFDPNLHDAAFMVKMDGKPDGTVFETIQKGFTLNGRVIRAAKVGVVKNS